MSEMSPSEEQCYHVGCRQYGGRDEYCEIRGRDADDDVAVAAEYIEELLFSGLELPESTVTYEAETQHSHLRREFALLAPDSQSPKWPLIETNVVIDRHTTKSPECMSYEIVTSWQVQQPAGIEEPPYATTYLLELWNDSAQATITEYDFQSESAVSLEPTKVVDRPMTAYDYTVLFELLREIDATLAAHAADVAVVKAM